MGPNPPWLCPYTTEGHLGTETNTQERQCEDTGRAPFTGWGMPKTVRREEGSLKQIPAAFGENRPAPYLLLHRRLPASGPVRRCLPVVRATQRVVLITAAPANPYSALIPSGAIWGENCSKFSSQTRVTCPSVAVGERDQTAWPSHAYTETLRTRQAGACGGGHPPRGACQHG